MANRLGAGVADSQRVARQHYYIEESANLKSAWYSTNEYYGAFGRAREVESGYGSESQEELINIAL
jgi:hypothetical protein